jgi:signal transduction histidine kinase
MWKKFFSSSKSPQNASPSEAFIHSDQLKRANEEIYKRSVELVEKNKILSLLDSLYNAVIHIVDLDKISGKLSEEIAAGLEVFYCAIVLYHPEDGSMELAGHAAKDKTPMPFLKKHIVINNKSGFDFKKVGDGSSASVMDVQPLLEDFFSRGLWLDRMAKMQAKIFHIYPLLANGENSGLLMIGLNRDERQLNEFERKAIPMVVNMVSLAISKANVYQQLKEANFRLQELDQQKTEFLSIAAHQLRTPLTIFKGYLELLDDGAYGKMPKESGQVISDLNENNEHLIKLVDEFLDITRIEQGRTKYDFKVGDIRTVLGEAIKQLKEKAEEKSCKINYHRGAKLPTVVMDSEKMYHVIYNFIDNAIKYGQGSDIEVMAQAQDDGVAVKVKDSGLGFGKTDEVNFFQKLYRGENVKGVNVTGTGLGLFVCRKFMEAHGGRVWATSPGVGKGSEFGFWIPLAGNPVGVKERQGT